MSVKISINGMDITVADTTEAAELIAKLSGQTEKPPGNKVNTVKADTSEKAFRRDVVESAYAFLSAIDNTGDRGAESEYLVKALKLSHPKGIGGRTGPINSMFERLGFKVHQVYENARNQEGKRVWQKGRKFDDALKAVREQMN